MLWFVLRLGGRVAKSRPGWPRFSKNPADRKRAFSYCVVQMAGFFEVLREVVSLTATVSRLEKDNERLRSAVHDLELRVIALEGSGAVIAERAARAASEAATGAFLPIMERVIKLEVSSSGAAVSTRTKAEKLVSHRA